MLKSTFENNSFPNSDSPADLCLYKITADHTADEMVTMWNIGMVGTRELYIIRHLIVRHLGDHGPVALYSLQGGMSQNHAPVYIPRNESLVL